MLYQIAAILTGFAVFWAFNAPRCKDGLMSYFESFKDVIVKLDAEPTSRIIGGFAWRMFFQLSVLVTALAMNWPLFAIFSMVWALFYWIRLFIAYHLQVSEA
jgi:hypothetical protein